MICSRRTFLAFAAGAVVAASRRHASAAEPLWSLRGGVDASTMFNDQILTVGSRVRVIDVETGSERRSAPVNKPSNAEGPAAIAATPGGIVFGWYVWDEGVRIVCLDEPSLKVRWQRRLKISETERDGAVPKVFPISRPDGVFVKVSEKPGDNLLRLSPESGEVVWARNVSKFTTPGPLLWHNDRLLLHSRDHHWGRGAFSNLHAIDAATGATVWQVRLEGKSGPQGDTTLIVGERAYTTSNVYTDAWTGRIYVIDVAAGVLGKSLTVPRLGEPFAYQDEILYTAGDQPTAWETTGGRPIWRMVPPTSPDRVVYIKAGVLDVRRKRIYLGESDSSFYVLSATDGSVLHTVDVRRGYTSKNFMSRYGAYGFHLHGDRLIVDAGPDSLLAFDARFL